MAQKSSFEVFWSDVSYRVRPFVSLGEVCDNISRSTQRCVDSLLESNKRKSYDLQPQGSKKEAVTILRNVSGSFRSGELTAVMGPSGAGKTSLLNLVSRRKEKGYTGRLYISGPNSRLKISTIPQNDYLPPYLTVRENLLFASRLKNMATDFDHERVVDEVAKVLDLERCINTMTNSISGGQQKRVSIAQELVSRPDILILDEPTSGLDSLTCFKTLEVLKNLVKSSTENPIAILLTIHQPEHNVFDIFDRVYALAPGGIAIYNGPPKECANYIRKHTGLKMPYAEYNPASFLIEIASAEHGQQPIDTLRRQVESCSVNHSNLGVKPPTNNIANKLGLNYTVYTISPDVMWNNSQTGFEKLDIDKRLVIGSSIRSGHFWTKTRILSHRYYKSQIRDPKQLISSIIIHIMLPFAMLLIMGKEAGRVNSCPRLIRQFSLIDMAKDDELIKEETLTELEQSLENTATIFISTYSILAVCTGIATLSFTLDMLSSLKEYHNGWYSIDSYMLARVITDLPSSILLPTICMTLTFFLTGQEAGGSLNLVQRSLLASLSTILGTIAAKLIGMIFGALFMGQVITALFTSQAVYMPLVMISGFLVRPKNMKTHIEWLSQISIMKHNMELNILARYGFNVCQCNPSELKDVAISGVSDQLKRVTQYYLNQMSEEDEEGPLQAVNGTDNVSESEDLFQLFAEQVSLFNSFGRKIVSCDQVLPQQMYEISVLDKDFVPIVAKYSVLVLGIMMLLLLTVKLVVKFKTSL